MLGSRTESYQPLGDLRLKFNFAGPVEDYRRELDLDQALATVTYTAGGVRIVREVLASRPDDIIALHIRAEGGGAKLLCQISGRIWHHHILSTRRLLRMAC